MDRRTTTHCGPRTNGRKHPGTHVVQPPLARSRRRVGVVRVMCIRRPARAADGGLDGPWAASTRRSASGGLPTGSGRAGSRDQPGPFAIPDQAYLRTLRDGAHR